MNKNRPSTAESLDSTLDWYTCVEVVEGQTYRQNDATVSMKNTTWQE